MNYSPEQFSALIQEVEDQGGALLPEPCAAQDIKFTDPPYSKAHVEKKVTCHCNNESRLVLPYEGLNVKDKPLKRASFVTACAVCDGVGTWPRIIDAVFPQEDPEQ